MFTPLLNLKFTFSSLLIISLKLKFIVNSLFKLNPYLKCIHNNQLILKICLNRNIKHINLLLNLKFIRNNRFILKVHLKPTTSPNNKIINPPLNMHKILSKKPTNIIKQTLNKRPPILKIIQTKQINKIHKQKSNKVLKY
jgi:hypothetical protein